MLQNSRHIFPVNFEILRRAIGHFRKRASRSNVAKDLAVEHAEVIIVRHRIEHCICRRLDVTWNAQRAGKIVDSPCWNAGDRRIGLLRCRRGAAQDLVERAVTTTGNDQIVALATFPDVFCRIIGFCVM